VAEHSFDAAELLRRAERINWPDKELLEALVHGVVDHSEDTPKLCVVTWPGKGVAEHTAELSDKVDAEVRQGWIRDREGAASVPMVWRGVGVVLKASGKIRLVVNRSDRRTTRVWDGRRFVAVSPNQNTATDEFTCGKEKPLAAAFDSIGGNFVYRPEKERVDVGPRAAVVTKPRAMTDRIAERVPAAEREGMARPPQQAVEARAGGEEESSEEEEEEAEKTEEEEGEEESSGVEEEESSHG